MTSKPSCANSSWTLYSTGSSPAEQVQDGYLFCCDEGSVGLNVGQCWASSDIVSGSVAGYATASAVSSSVKPLRSLEEDGGEFECLNFRANNFDIDFARKCSADYTRGYYYW